MCEKCMGANSSQPSKGLDSGLVLIVTLLIVIVIFLVIAYIYTKSPPPSSGPIDPSIYTNQYEGFAFWGPETPVNGERGICQYYDFPATVSTTPPECASTCSPVCNETIPSVLGQISVNPDVIDKLVPVLARGCYNPDQVVLRKVTRTCKTLPPNTTLLPALPLSALQKIFLCRCFSALPC